MGVHEAGDEDAAAEVNDLDAGGRGDFGGDGDDLAVADVDGPGGERGAGEGVDLGGLDDELVEVGEPMALLQREGIYSQLVGARGKV